MRKRQHGSGNEVRDGNFSLKRLVVIADAKGKVAKGRRESGEELGEGGSLGGRGRVGARGEDQRDLQGVQDGRIVWQEGKEVGRVERGMLS